ncbi:MAG TPA: hypothetical protein GX507_08000 [Clostridia bacterium]|nr:hypothetical protein [Clostridia bacterium]
MTRQQYGTDGWPVRPMLAQSAPRPFDSPEHLFEVKWDGYRCIAHIQGERVRLQSRNLKDMTSQFPEFADIRKAIKGDALILDGEVIAIRDGLPDFSALRNHQGSPVYVAFDILRLGREWLFEMPLATRKERLREVVDQEVGSICGIIVSDFVEKDGIAFFEAVSRKGLEGIIAKEVHGVYRPGVRSRSWLKIRNFKTVDAVICGYTTRPGGGLGALMLGLQTGSPRGRPHEVRYIGLVGTGFSEREGEYLISVLRPTGEPVFSHDDIERIKRSRRGRLGGPRVLPYGIPYGTPRLEEEKTVTAHVQHSAQEQPSRGYIQWVEPELVCEVKYTEVTPDGVLRHPVYVRLRPDKNVAECTLDQIRRNKSLGCIHE